MVRERVPLPETPPRAAAPVAPAPQTATPPRPAGPVDITGFPRLSNSDKARLGLDDLKLNVLREATDTRPEALAIINLNKVYVGENIPGTDARLIAVTRHGIGIEMRRTGDRYYVQH